MARWRGWITRALLLLCAMVGASGCDEGEIDGVVWQYVWATQMASFELP